MKKKIDCWHLIPLTLANLPGIAFVYLFITPLMKNPMGRFVDWLIELSNISLPDIVTRLSIFVLFIGICAICLIAYYHWRDDDSEDTYLSAFCLNIGFIVLIIILLGLSYNYKIQGSSVIQNCLISILFWSFLRMTAKQLNNYNITKNILLANVVILCPIIISLLAFIKSYFD